MPVGPRLVRVLTSLVFGAVAASSQTAVPATRPVPEPPSLWQQALRDSPMLRSLASFFDLSPVDPPLPGNPAVARLTGSCSVAPLEPIDDPAALQLENNSLSDELAGVVDVADMLPDAARALQRFQSSVVRAGGAIVLKSAYRPSAYQKHLQSVWYKWMNELRDNAEPGCQDLRAQVQEEFARHRLIETQHPVAISDHTRGIAFDATVELPRNARLGRRRLTLDGLARMAGLLRPAVAADPVHFKFLGVRRVAAARRQHSA